MYTYKKRDGTSGISGQLYETKLLSLVLFRLQRDPTVEQFYLATNMDEVGAFDDICFKVTLAGVARPLCVFMQCKHKEDGDSFLNYDLIKHFYVSYIKVKQNFYSNKDVFFRDGFENTHCVFVLYTNAKYSDERLEHASKQTRRLYQSSFAQKLNELVSTGERGSQAEYTAEELQSANDIILEEEITTLADTIVKFVVVKPKQALNMMLDKYMLRYHVILAKHVVDVSPVRPAQGKSGQPWRDLTFKKSFLSENLSDDTLVMFRRRIYDAVIKSQIRNNKKNKSTKAKNANDDTGECDARDANTQLLEDEASDKLSAVDVKVPATFGNVDMTISSGADNRINTLAEFIEKLRNKSQSVGSHQVVTIDKTDGEGFLKLNNGIGSAVGNLLVYDISTKLLKFTESSNSLQSNAKALFDALNLNDPNNHFHSLRFDAKAVMFPKLEFDYSEEAKVILNQVVVFDKQSNQNGVELKLKEAIERHDSAYQPQSVTIQTDTIIVFYHNEIQKLWMLDKTGTYFTKNSDEFQKAINNIVAAPQMSALQTTFNMNTKKYFGYDFSEDAVESLNSLGARSKTIIVTDLSTLTAVKVIQCLRRNRISEYAVLDLECVLHLPPSDTDALHAELERTTKLLIVICDAQNRALHDKLNELAKHVATLVEDKQVIVVTNNALLNSVQGCYLRTRDVINDQQQSIRDLAPELRSAVIKHAQVLFQGAEVTLDLLVDDVSQTFVKGAVLNKLIRNETITIGKPLTSATYEDIKHLYVDRRVRLGLTDDTFRLCGDKEDYTPFFVRKFPDIDKDIVLITATPGMGKSTLLTHLSLKTKELDTQLWIVRINLLDFSKVFHCWKIDGTVINRSETVKFICKVIVTNNDPLLISLKETDSKMYLDECTGDEWTVFELNMFLHHYNEKRVMFLFDGFDEICPQYKEQVFQFLNIVKQYPRRHRMWVTSRPYSEILIDLERALGRCYEMEYINDAEQDVYLDKCWRSKFAVQRLSDAQLRNVTAFIQYMMKKNDPGFGRIAYLFYDHVRLYFPLIEMRQPKYSKYQSIVLVPSLTNILGEPTQKSAEVIMGTPLLLYLYANYFIHRVCTEETADFSKLNGKYSTLAIYEDFVEMKLKKIVFEQKNKMFVYNPEIIKIYEKERAECLDMHKKIAAYNLLFQDLDLEEMNVDGPFNKEGLIEYGAIIYEIKNGIEKSGFVSHVTFDNVPVFIYRSLAEYFAAEFVCDVFKSGHFGFGHKNIVYTISQMYFEVKTWINKKREVDVELNRILKYIEGKRPVVSDLFGHIFGNGWTLEHIIRIRSSVEDDYDSDFFTQYNHDTFKGIRRLSQRDANKKLVELQKNIVGKMKPHLRQHFVETLELFLTSVQETD